MIKINFKMEMNMISQLMVILALTNKRMVYFISKELILLN